jgi:hypothetical protein
MRLPNEVVLQIYDYCDAPTRISMNRAFNWDYRHANPFQGRPWIFLPAHYLYHLSNIWI